jgi:hypothetical protein
LVKIKLLLRVILRWCFLPQVQRRQLLGLPNG